MCSWAMELVHCTPAVSMSGQLRYNLSLPRVSSVYMKKEIFEDNFLSYCCLEAPEEETNIVNGDYISGDPFHHVFQHDIP